MNKTIILIFLTLPVFTFASGQNNTNFSELFREAERKCSNQAFRRPNQSEQECINSILHGGANSSDSIKECREQKAKLNQAKQKATNTCPGITLDADWCEKNIEERASPAHQYGAYEKRLEKKDTRLQRAEDKVVELQKELEETIAESTKEQAEIQNDIAEMYKEIQDLEEQIAEELEAAEQEGTNEYVELKEKKAQLMADISLLGKKTPGVQAKYLIDARAIQADARKQCLAEKKEKQLTNRREQNTNTALSRSSRFKGGFENCMKEKLLALENRKVTFQDDLIEINGQIEQKKNEAIALTEKMVNIEKRLLDKKNRLAQNLINKRNQILAKVQQKQALSQKKQQEMLAKHQRIQAELAAQVAKREQYKKEVDRLERQILALEDVEKVFSADQGKDILRKLDALGEARAEMEAASTFLKELGFETVNCGGTLDPKRGNRGSDADR